MRYWLQQTALLGTVLLLLALLPGLGSPIAMLLAGFLAAATGMAVCGALDYMNSTPRRPSAQ